MIEKLTEVMQRITFLEKDLELQKHILRATPTGEEEKNRDVVVTIADIKEKLEGCRQEIKALDPEEYNRMIRFEDAAAAFKESAKGREFVTVVDLNTHAECSLQTVEGTSIPCLVKAQDSHGEWLVMTVDGDVMTFSSEQVVG